MSKAWLISLAGHIHEGIDVEGKRTAPDDQHAVRPCVGAVERHAGNAACGTHGAFRQDGNSRTRFHQGKDGIDIGDTHADLRFAASILKKRERAAAEAEADLVDRQQQFFPHDIASRNSGAGGQRMTFRQRNAQFRAVEGHGPQGLGQRGKGRTDESNIGLARFHLLDQLFHRHAGQKLQRHIPVLITIAGDERRQLPLGHHTGTVTDAQRAELTAPDLLRLFERAFGAGKDFFRLDEHGLPGRSEFHTAIDAVKELEAQVLLQLPDALGNGWLGDTELEGGGPEVSGPSGFHKYGELASIHGGEVFVLSGFA
ncbi:hypothetical protein AGR6A_Lc160139 [Agrobacterium sp. NCPPB 925]|nr:hypothetical protein AGR6A_Lc160139 [Agrobacterium sp. NCPPB 925]